MEDNQAGISVTLVRFSEPAAPSVDAELNRLEAMRGQLVGELPADLGPDSAKPQVDPQALLKAFDERHGASTPSSSDKASEAHPSQPGAKGQTAAIDDPLARASVPPATIRTPGQAELWRQLTHCWKPDRSFPTVKITVVLDDHGALASAPSIQHGPQFQADPTRQRAETEAIRALIACAPYSVGRDFTHRFDLEFSREDAGSGWR